MIHVFSYGPAKDGAAPKDLEVGDSISVVIGEVDLERDLLGLLPDGLG